VRICSFLPSATEVALEGEVETDEVHFIFAAPQTTFGVTLQLMEHKGPGPGA
jgi:hypothetical protein